MSCHGIDHATMETFTSYLEEEDSDTSPSHLEDGFEKIWGEEAGNLVLSLPDSPSEASAAEQDDISSSKLCGYLSKYKIGARGKVFKKRWFVFSDRTCKLLYYRTPQDLVPLGDIDIAGATFSFHVGTAAAGRENVFEISSDGKVMQLEAPDRQTMMYWLQELQDKRRIFSQHRTEKARQSAESKLRDTLDNDMNTEINKKDRESLSDLLGVINLPNSTVGLGTAASGSSSNVSDISFTNWRTELRNLLAGMRPVNRRYSDCEAMKAIAKHHKQAPTVGQLIELEQEQEQENRSEKESSPETGSEPNVGSSRQRDSAWNNFRRRIKARSGPADISHPMSGSGQNTCVKCKELENFISNMKMDFQVLEEELIVHQELVKQIEKQNDVLKKEKETQKEMSLCFTDHDQIEVLHARDQRIVELEHFLGTIKEERETCRQQIGDLKRQIASLQQQLENYHRSIKAKDEQIIKFVEQINDLEGVSMNKENSYTFLETEEVNRLRDAAEGYEMQNRFLSKEILELNRLRKDDTAREEHLILECKEWEAKFFQIQSKYLLCLDQLHAPIRGNEKDSDMVNQLLEDAMENVSRPFDDHTRTRSWPPADQYDEYGFSKVNDDGGNLTTKAQNSKRRSEMLMHKDIEREMSHACKWENFLEKQGRQPLQRSPELKQLTRGGIPNNIRKKVWNMFVSLHVRPAMAERDGRLYHTCLNAMKRTTCHNPASKQIELDLLRTLPHNRHYESFQSENVPKLRRVLLAYAQHNPHIGYCQGLNRLAAIALLFLEEEEAFWCMKAIIEHIMPNDYYSPTLQAAQSDQRVLKEFLHEKCPRLIQHLEKNEVDISLFTFNWFLTIFVDNIPVETYLRIWDTFLYEGNKVLFRYAIAFLKYREDDIVACPTSMQIHNYLRTLGSDISDIDRVTQIAFTEINPFSMRQVNAKRQVHNEKVKAELAELDKLRQDFRTNSMAETGGELLSDEDN